MALRDEEELVRKGRCAREPNFREMYNVLGDEAALEGIRLKNEDNHHCTFLKKSARACEEFPIAVGEAKIGSPCPSNPYRKYAALYESVNRRGALLNHAHYIGELVEFGHLATPDRLFPDDFAIAVIMRNQAKKQEFEAMSLGALRGSFGGGSREGEGE